MDDGNLANNTMITALQWVSRGFAKPVLETQEADRKVMMAHSKFQKKLAM